MDLSLTLGTRLIVGLSLTLGTRVVVGSSLNTGDEDSDRFITEGWGRE